VGERLAPVAPVSQIAMIVLVVFDQPELIDDSSYALVAAEF
jgi:hypothetical protein